MLREYLSSSSIHGLSYLAEQRGLARLLWFAAISVAFGVAGILAVRNVQSWQNQPSVISSVEYELVEGLPVMPKVTVCPRTPNVNSILLKLMRKYPHVVKGETASELGSELVGLCLRAEAAERTSSADVPFYSLRQSKHDPDRCFPPDGEESGTEPCKLVRVLASMVTYAMRLTWGKDDVVNDGIFEYLSAVQIGSAKLSLEAFQAFMLEENAIVSDLNATEASRDWHRIERPYLAFFPAYVKAPAAGGRGHTLDALPLESIENFRSLCKPPESIYELATALSYVIDTGILEHYDESESFNRLPNSLINAVARLWLEVLMHFLETDGVEETMAVLNLLAYDEHSRLFQRYPQEHKDLFPCGTKENITSSCDRVKLLEELTELEQECLYFCQDSMLLEDQERKTKVLELLWMGVDGPGLGRSDEESDQEGPSMLVSNCHASFGELVERPCWTRVVNDRGVCFSTVPDTSLSTIAGTGPQHPLQFVTDTGGSFGIQNYIYGGEVGTARTEYEPPGKVRISWTSSSYGVAKRTGYWRGFDIFLGQQNQHTASHSMKVSAGTLSIPVTVENVLEGTEAFGDLALEQRGCYYPSEVELEHFSVYSEGNCYLECAWEAAGDRCGCVPWFLAEHFPGKHICLTYGNLCFKQVVDGRYTRKGRLAVEPQCREKCLPDCQRVQYSVGQVQAIPR